MNDSVVNWTDEVCEAESNGYDYLDCRAPGTFERGHDGTCLKCARLRLNAAAAKQFADVEEQAELRQVLLTLAEMEEEKEKENPNLGTEAAYLRHVLEYGVVLQRGKSK